MKQSLWILLLLVFTAFLGYLFWPNYSKLGQLDQQNQELERKITLLEQQNIELRKNINALRTDPVYLERIARDELSMSQEDEIIYKFKSDSIDSSHS